MSVVYEKNVSIFVQKLIQVNYKMKSTKPKKMTTLEHVVNALEIKKEVKLRASKGETLSSVVEEKGYQIVFPV